MRCKLRLAWFLMIVAGTGSLSSQVLDTVAILNIKEKLKGDWGYTDRQLQKLSAAGIDLADSLVKMSPITDERVLALLSDYVVIGTVEKIVPIPGPRSAPFHSRADVIVSSILRGSKNISRLGVLLESGPMDSDTTIRISTDPHFTPGSLYLLMLVYPDRSPLLRSQHLDRIKGTRADYVDKAFWASRSSVHKIDDGVLLWKGTRRDIGEVTRRIKHVVSLLSSD